MKKIFSVCAIAAMGGLALLPSCKKSTNNTRPTPNNIRVVSYTLIDSIYLSGKDTSYTLNDNYRFFYDASKRVTKILFTSIDVLRPSSESHFTYKGDTVFKTIYPLGSANIVEKDTFVLNSDGLIKTAYYQDPNLYYGMQANYDYYQGLLSREELIARDYEGTLSATSTWTSVDGDLLKHNFDNVLTAKFDKLADPPINQGYALDTVYWYTKNYVLLSTQSHVGSFTATYNNYLGQPMNVVGRDVWGNIDTLYFPGVWYQQAYDFYTQPDSLNRPGDYMQIASFTNTGINIFRNKHIARKITSQGRSTAISYNIDSDSKIKQMFVIIKDSAMNIHTQKFDFQYEIY